MQEFEIALELIVEVNSLMNDAQYIGLDIHQATTAAFIAWQ